MEYLQAKNRILALRKAGNDAYQKVGQLEYKQMYYAVVSHLNDKGNEWQMAIGSFLVHGAMSFDRYVELRPKVADEEQYEMFCRFLNALQKIDGTFMGRTAFFHLQKAKWDLYRECSVRPCNKEMLETMAQIEEEVNGLAIPRDDPRVAGNLEKQKEEIVGMISAIRDGRIRTVIHTTLPYKLTGRDAELHLVVDGVEVNVKTKHRSQGSSIPVAQVAEGSTMATTGPSKWTTTTCEVDIEAHCLTDILEERPKVLLRDGDDNGGYWTASYDFTFKVISAIWAYIHQHEEVTGAWPPLPTDIHYIDCRVYAGDIEYDHEFSTNPALVYHITSMKKPGQVIEIGNDTEPRWSVYTYMMAKVYAESGQLKEAIFWLNVSVEAMVEEFVQKVATTDGMLAEIEGVEYKFDTAEEILCEQFPDMRGKVKWPEVAIHTSVFTKLKRAVRESHLAGQEKDIIKKYQQINAKRNGLFHGVDAEISVEDVEKAFGAYAWLKERIG